MLKKGGIDLRILVFSDSHGDCISMKIALSLYKKIDCILFLGDGEYDFNSLLNNEMLNGIKTFAVCGNCDYGSNLPKEMTMEFCEKKIYFVHGHTKYVKYGLDELILAAKENKADIALYGHTHTAMKTYVDGVHIMCPGSIREGFYGIVDITDAGIVCFTCNLNN
ncbi:MAG: YfcE family phosphodiesterase [Oscillospiraceae bacterium]